MTGLIIFRAHWTQQFDGCVPTNCFRYDSVVIADSKERVKQLISRRFRPADVLRIAQIGEVTEDSSDEFQQEGFFFLQSQALRG